MKKISFLMAVILGFAFQAMAINPYAFGVSATLSGSNVSVNYSLNTDAAAVALQFCQADQVKASVALTGVTKGAHNETVAVPATLVSGDYTLKVAATGAAHDFEATAIEGKSFTGRIHATVDPYPTSPNFGNIYVTSRDGNERGMFFITPDYTYESTEVERFGMANADWGSCQRGAVAPNGEMWYSSWSDGNSGIHRHDHSAATPAVTQFFLGARNGDGLFINEGAETGCSTPGIAIYEDGANTKLYMVAEDFSDGNTKGSLAIYNIGQADGSIVTSWGTAPSAHFNTLTDKDNTNFCVAPTPYGVWLAQHRAAGSNNAGARSLQFVGNDGVQKYISSEDPAVINGSMGAGVLANRDGSKLYLVNGNGNLMQFSIAWTDGTPALTVDTVYTTPYNAISQMTFDYAGNIVASVDATGSYTSSTTGSAVAVITLPATEAPVAATPIAGSFQITSDAPVVPQYYLAGSMNGWTVNGTPFVNGQLDIQLAAGNYEFKVTKGTWDWELNATHVDHTLSSANVRAAGGNNIHISLAEAGNVHIAVVNDASLVITGNFFPKDIVSTWTVVGDETLVGSDWDLNDANNTMAANGDIFTLNKQLNLAEGSYKWKVVGDHSWATQYPASGDFYINITNAGFYSIDFNLDFAADSAWAVVTEVRPMIANPIGADGRFIVKYDCENNCFAAANDMEIGETFTMAIDLTGTWLADYINADPTRGLAVNKWTSRGGVNINVARFRRIEGDIWGMTVNFSQHAEDWIAGALLADSTTTVYAQFFAFDTNNGWWMWDGHEVVTTQAPGADGLFQFAPSTGKQDEAFTTSDMEGEMYGYNIAGYAAPCATLLPPVGPTYEHLYEIGDNQGWKPAEGIELTKTADNVFEGTITFTAETSWFAFTTVQSEDWGLVNASRFGGANNNELIVVGQTTAIIMGGDGNCLTAPAGSFKFVVDLNQMTVAVSEATALDNINANDNVRKVIENGHVYIIRNGVRYTVSGAVVE